MPVGGLRVSRGREAWESSGRIRVIRSEACGRGSASSGWPVPCPFDVIGLSLAGIVISAILAALWSARRAAKIDILAAIATA
jgi:ABC-type antimicrobial peptide transport system permease subunit